MYNDNSFIIKLLNLTWSVKYLENNSEEFQLSPQKMAEKYNYKVLAIKTDSCMGYYGVAFKDLSTKEIIVTHSGSCALDVRFFLKDPKF